jgi:toprim domain protein
MDLKEEILARTNRGLEVLYFYMPIAFVPKRNFRNPLYNGTILFRTALDKTCKTRHKT